MASSSQNHKVSSEEIKLFHTIDRAIFSRLVLKLRREPFESVHVMALFLWLEHYCNNGRNLIHTIRTWPDTLIDALADEGVLCLSCINNDEIDRFSLSHVEDIVIPLIRKLTNNEASFSFFRQHRVEMVQGIVQLVRDVCFRAFDDIIGLIINPIAATANDRGPLIRPILPVYGEISLRDQKKALKNEIEDLWKRVQSICINKLEEKSDEEVEVDDRTIFLTFSKGYSVSKDEVRDFFTRKSGEIFEEIEMQEVPEGEQPLYAKLVLVSGSNIPMVLNGKPKAKFSINGKHVWARKYVRKNHKSPPSK